MININNKQWEKLRFSDIEKLLAGTDDETFFFEFKSDKESPAKLVKEVSAFSNTYGGYILLGITDDKTIEGCKQWTEQRIHTTIHDSITPIPNFDVKRLRSGAITIFVIKINEGTMPPYITDKGQIFERVSSGSFPINDSAKLSQLYNKRSDQLKCIKDKIEIEPIRIDSSCPNNLCGYLDLGFSTTLSKITKLQNTFYTYDFTPVTEILKSHTAGFSISRLGHSILISVGIASASSGDNKTTLLNSGIHNFIEIMCDGSVRLRAILISESESEKVDISTITYLRVIAEKVYTEIFQENFSSIFISAQKYEKLTVIKQFIPYYNLTGSGKEVKLLNAYLPKHIEKYGNNLMVENSRLPKSDYFIIDKRWFDTRKIKYNTKNLIDELFHSDYSNLGFIDRI